MIRKPVSVIVPVYRDLERLSGCLEALERQTVSEFEVIVVDNGRNDGIEELVGSFPNVRLVRETKHGSYAARNAGIAIAQGDVIVFTDADCRPEPDWLEHGLRYFDEEPDLGLLAGHIRVTFRDPDRPNAVELYDAATEFKQDDYVEEERYGATANVFTTRRVLDTVGLFDDRLKSYGDVDWGNRVDAAGFTLRYAPDVVVQHPARTSWRALARKTARLLGGAHDARTTPRDPFLMLLRRMSYDLVKPVRTHRRLAAEANVHGSVQHTRFFLVHGGLALVRASERLRLWLGRPSRRR